MEQFWNLSNEYGFGHDPVSANSDCEMIEGFQDYNAVPEYLNDVLMEDEGKDMSCLIEDSTLHAAEKSFYHMLNQAQHPSPNEQIRHQESISSDSAISNSVDYCCSGHINGNYLAKTRLIDNFCNPARALDHPADQTILSKPILNCPLKSSNVTGDGPMLMQAPINIPMESQFNSQFKWGVRDNDKKILEGKANAEKSKDELTYSLQQGRRIIQDDSRSEEGGSSKQLAFSTEESVLSEMIDKILHFDCENDEPTSNSNADVSRKKRIGKKDHSYLKNLLFQCMQAVASNDHYTADGLLEQIKQSSSPSGDASQRLTHCFAKGLEARLVGTGNLIYRSLTAKVMSTSDAMKAYKLYNSAIPFINASHYYRTQTILDLAKKATSLHIIQFGSKQAIHFVPIIRQLSNRSGGPPKLRITGINFPFEPTAMVGEAGRRLGNYCNRFSVPFEYHVVLQKWETVNLEDLKIQKDEVLVVMCSDMLHFLIDDSVSENSPRDAVLELIKRINPDVFLHEVKNAKYNLPFFISRFREAFFHYSALFDMSEATMPRGSPWRMVYETEIWGKEILNTVACEGLERIDRPETYREWQKRTLRAGFRQLPLNQEIIKKIKAKVKANYHRDIFVDEADQWMVQGWKGRVLDALSCGKPS